MMYFSGVCVSHYSFMLPGETCLIDGILFFEVYKCLISNFPILNICGIPFDLIYFLKKYLTLTVDKHPTKCPSNFSLKDGSP